jgi:hypothetical protein
LSSVTAARTVFQLRELEIDLPGRALELDRIPAGSIAIDLRSARIDSWHWPGAATISATRLLSASFDHSQSYALLRDRPQERTSRAGREGLRAPTSPAA